SLMVQPSTLVRPDSQKTGAMASRAQSCNAASGVRSSSVMIVASSLTAGGYWLMGVDGRSLIRWFHGRCLL
ncbi:MAG: hypothetical protein ACXW3P_05840, partial [Rhodospirillales bacterium]